jgi:hypothetical protein
VPVVLVIQVGFALFRPTGLAGVAELINPEKAVLVGTTALQTLSVEFSQENNPLCGDENIPATQVWSALGFPLSQSCCEIFSELGSKEMAMQPGV